MQLQYFVGLDLGQAHDYSAVAVTERAETQGAWDPVMFAHRKVTAVRLRHLERIRLGTTYPDIVTRAGLVTRAPELSGRCQLIVDGTGCGRPVVDMLRAARLQCPILPVGIVHGAMETHYSGYYHVPKRDLVAGVQIALQTGALQIASGMKWVREMLQEMTEMRVRVSRAGNESFAVSKRGAHDDLVVALALSLWGMRKVYPRCFTGEAGYWVREARWRVGG